MKEVIKIRLSENPINNPNRREFQGKMIGTMPNASSDNGTQIKYSSDMKADILEIITQHKFDNISSEQAVSKLLDLFAVNSRTLIPNEIKYELQRRIGIIESETDDFTRQSMISNITVDLI